MALVSTVLAYLKARFELAGLESKEAGLHYLIVVALICGGLMIVVFGYLFLCLALVFLVAWALGDGHAWIWVTLGMALLHFCVGALLLFLAKKRFAAPMFESTLNEFKKDQEWLNSKTAKTP